MLNLLIINEEQIIRNQPVFWQNLGVGMVQKAAGGDEALAVAEQFGPELVLCPLRLFETCLKLRALYPDCRFLFIADYGETDHPKAPLGDAQYLQKPVSAEQLSEVIRKAVQQTAVPRSENYTPEETRPAREEMQRAVLRRLAYGTAAYPQRKMPDAELFSGPMSAYRFCVLRAEQDVHQANRLQQALLRTLSCLPKIAGEGEWAASFLDHRDFCILLGGEEESIGMRGAFLKALRERVESDLLPGGRWFMAVGRCVESPAQLSRSFYDVQLAARNLFFSGWSAYAAAESARPILPANFSRVPADKLLAAVSSGNREDAEKQLEALYGAAAVQTDADPAEIRNMYCGLEFRMIMAQVKGAAADEAQAQALGLAKLQHAETLEALHACFAENVRHRMGEKNPEEQQSTAVQAVLRILREEFSDKELSVKSLAERVYLTPTYLSALFRKYTGKTIGQVLTELRIEYALKLLADKQLKLYRVAQMTGYDDPNYFAKIFKRHLGMTPSEYREHKGI